MANKLSSITREHMLLAFDKIDQEGIPKDNEYNLYWLLYAGRRYPYKYSVELASNLTSTQVVTTDFQSNDGYRNIITSLGFPIQYHAIANESDDPKFFVGSSFYGKEPNLEPKLDDFIKNKYWRTDHDLTKGVGLRIYKLLQTAKINDRIAIRSFARRNRTIQIVAIGTITDVSEITDGKLKVIWDYKPWLYQGPVPSGGGSGNWSLTLIEMTRAEDIELIFGFARNNKRAARLTWNDNGYIFPSGLTGKSRNKDAHEGKFGYGHEEWLFDNSKLIDGYHYGFLEPIRKHQGAYLNKIYDIWLYTLNADTKLRYTIGEIKQVEVLNPEQAANAKKIYEHNGWLAEMENQIKLSGANEKGFSGYNGLDHFNIRFLPENLRLNDPYEEIPENHPITEIGRYSFLFMKNEFKLPEADPSKPFGYVPPDIIGGVVSKKAKRKTSVRAPKSVEITYIHRAISDNLTIKLRSIYGDKNVNPEHTAGYGQHRIDIVVNDVDGLIFYEIKSYNSMMTSIREAIGQLLEYALWPAHKKAKKMIVVTQTVVNPDVRTYFKHLRDEYGLPLYYQSYDYKKDFLSEEY